MLLSEKKHYYNGIDWVAAALNYQCRLTPARGNNFLIVLDLGAHPFSSAKKTRLLDACNAILPLLNGSIRRAWHLAPYWQTGNGSGVPFSENSPADDAGADSVLYKFMNEPLPEDTGLEIKLISFNGSGRLIFKFSHLLFDGRGAELFLRAIDGGHSDLMAMHPGLPHPELNNWTEQFKAGKIVHRKRLAILEKHKIAALPSGQLTAMPARFRVIQLDPAASAGLQKKSEREAGPFMLGIYLASIVCHCFDHFLDARGINGDIMLPMSVDLRGFGVPANTVFFNQWSFSPLIAERDEHRELAGWIGKLKKQMMSNAADKIPQSLRTASLLSRILPLPIMSLFSKNIFGQTAGSIMFSFVSGSSLAPSFIETPLRNMYHLPLMPPHPGIGVFFNSFEDRINAVISYREGILSEDEIDEFTQSIEKCLRKCHPQG
ncbi:MAG TPA: hypothetical protein DET40_16445 [Lentisphaeria bacterium]|nr:MAG: hypothetical protein A2X45_00975 [Lentisphaerae bacterium GWF2_50_93]HCE45132.1 hypothetical protein [Lentisphaeria bacterium]